MNVDTDKNTLWQRMLDLGLRYLCAFHGNTDRFLVDVLRHTWESAVKEFGEEYPEFEDELIYFKLVIKYSIGEGDGGDVPFYILHESKKRVV